MGKVRLAVLEGLTEVQLDGANNIVRRNHRSQDIDTLGLRDFEFLSPLTHLKAIAKTLERVSALGGPSGSPWDAVRVLTRWRSGLESSIKNGALE